MKTIFHVNQHIIRANRKLGKDDPPLPVKPYKERKNAHRATINGPAVVVYSAAKPLACGAHAWVETFAPVVCEEEKK